MGSIAHAQSLEIFELGKLGFWRNSYFQIKGAKIKIKEKKKEREMISHMIYA
jgi:hypothetical protein